MKITTFNSFIAVTSLVILSSCGKSDDKKQPTVFEQFAPETPEYQTELAKQIQLRNPDDLDYNFDSYFKKGNEEFLIVDVESDSLEAKAIVKVTDWSKLADLRKEKTGYSGATLNGFKMRTINDSTAVKFVFEDLQSIVD